MGFFFNGTPAADVSITGGMGALVPNSSQTIVSVHISSSSGSAETAHTVTAGKTFYMAGFTAVLSTGCDFTIYKTDGTTEVYRHAQGSIANTGCTSERFILSPHAWASGEYVKIKASSGTDVHIWGVEV